MEADPPTITTVIEPIVMTMAEVVDMIIIGVMTTTEEDTIEGVTDRTTTGTNEIMDRLLFEGVITHLIVTVLETFVVMATMCQKECQRFHHHKTRRKRQSI